MEDIFEQYRKKYYTRKNGKLVACKVTKYEYHWFNDRGVSRIEIVYADNTAVQLDGCYNLEPFLFYSIEDAIDNVDFKQRLTFKVEIDDVISFLPFIPKITRNRQTIIQLDAWKWDGYKPKLEIVREFIFDVLTKTMTVASSDKFYNSAADCLIDNNVEIIDFDD